MSTQCIGVCPREQAPRDAASPGVIGDEELICRGVYPSDRARSGVVRRSLIAARHLWEGQLSVWRVSDRSGLTIEMLAEILTPMQRSSGERIDEIRSATASNIRAMKIEDSEARSVSLLDECTCDREGNKHQAHAHIAVCDLVKAAMKGPEDERFIGLQEGLKLLFERRVDWTSVERAGARE